MVFAERLEMLFVVVSQLHCCLVLLISLLITPSSCSSIYNIYYRCCRLIFFVTRTGKFFPCFHRLIALFIVICLAFAPNAQIRVCMHSSIFGLSARLISRLVIVYDF